MKFLNIYLFICLTLSVSAQSTLEKSSSSREGVKKALDEAVALMDSAKYEIADQHFREILKNSQTVSSDLTYYFGKNSYHLKKYKQSIDWLGKYLQLNGSTGNFSTSAEELKKKSEAELLVKQKEGENRAKLLLSKEYDIDCGPLGKVICPVCNGTTVIVSKKFYGTFYKTCTHCDDHGMLTCAQFNQLLKGKL